MKPCFTYFSRTNSKLMCVEEQILLDIISSIELILGLQRNYIFVVIKKKKKHIFVVLFCGGIERKFLFQELDWSFDFNSHFRIIFLIIWAYILASSGTRKVINILHTLSKKIEVMFHFLWILTNLYMKNEKTTERKLKS